ncbi:estrogen receptor-like receptor [Apostichopus japonicus]|uniref:Estrogen receptor-like receptor n=1 Tax=Stichopus japonicus TaxID=307972 RepID=A0A2G8LER6_STIJA|nr:estrogen receptor-like receptor [Apostichopus japonicus]
MQQAVPGVRHDRLRGGRQKYRRKPEEKDFAPAPSSKIAKYKRVEELISLLKNIEPLPTPGTPSSKVPELQNKDAIFRVIAISTTIADKALVNTVAWAKQIPGFKKLPLEDQMVLLQENWMEVLLWRVCQRSLDDEVGDRAVIADGIYLTKELAKMTDCELYFERGMSLIRKLRDISLDFSEFLLMKVVIFLNVEPRDARRSYRLLTSLPVLRQLSVESVELIARSSAENNVPLEKLHKEMVECKASGMTSRKGLASPSQSVSQVTAKMTSLSSLGLLSPASSDTTQSETTPGEGETLPEASELESSS